MIDPDDGLNQTQRTHQALHRAAAQILDAWPKAHEDANAIPLPSGGNTRHGSDPADPTGNTAINLHTNHAIAWIAELGDVLQSIAEATHLNHPSRQHHAVKHWIHYAINELFKTWTLDDIIDFDPQSPNYHRDVFGLERLADQAARWWPPPPTTGTRIGNITIGARTNTTETCHLCRNPITGTKQDPIRRKDGHPYHGKSCWYTATRGNATLHRITPKSA